ncbi:hypothetical protein PTSG_09818 [Salpingoeca rosetta]|uniref:NADH dehydrogenase [ubiquinone] 1 beta subcomplex subunit 4 n=1 Tax=Salpingoeca rosetta (strain ATCC 50818 / BSB-021) TaxID=946362 RepID=F2UP51_SALR5|nr:uncharacterized protein PTSG_09818 [Salpingoeca rosetta]EGD79406.1 hypothetical protein PTSG_09818 [Salpingoeca rosetta]|eukprot:XP_004989175.1 hypothetical protein PTSG_09818 [Salpingoeca rosetta]
MGGLKVDPAIERWGAMRETTVRHFRITPKTARQGFLWGLVVPLIIYEGAISEMKKRAVARGEEVPKFPSFFQ